MSTAMASGANGSVSGTAPANGPQVIGQQVDDPHADNQDTDAPGTEDDRTDAELLTAFRAGDVAVFSVLYQRHRPPAMRFARGLAASEFAANDAVSDGFLRVYSALSKGDGPTDAFRAYLFTAIRSAVVDDARRISRVRYTDDLAPYEDSTEPMDMAAVEEDREFISQAFSALTDQWKQVLWLTSVEGRRHNEVAEILGLKANAVAALALRAREGLRQNYLTAHLRTTDTRDECRRTVKNLAALVRAKISPREKSHAESHLLGCRRCRVAAVMLTDLNRVMPVVALPALLAPAPWLVQLHHTIAGAPIPDGGAPATSRTRDLSRRRRARHASGGRGRLASFASSHTLAVSAAAVLAAAVVAAAAVTAGRSPHRTAALGTDLRPTATSPAASPPAPTPSPTPTPTHTRSTPAVGHPAVSAAPRLSSPGRASSVPAPVNGPTGPNTSIVELVFQSLNNARAAHGLAPLAWYSPLERAAIAHTDAMTATHQQSHQVPGEPDFATRLVQHGASCSAAAENIGSTTVMTAAGAVQEEKRMENETPPGTTVHRDNILNPAYSQVGIAVGTDSVRKVLIITEDFCRP